MDQERLKSDMWRELDYVVKEIMSPKAPPRDVAGLPDLDYRPTLKGKAQGLSIALSIVTGATYERIREEARDRWAENEQGALKVILDVSSGQD